MIKRRLVVCVLVVVLTLGFAGCKKEVKTSEKSVTLTWLVPGDKQADLAEVLAAANAIIEPKIGAKLEIQFIDAGAFSERMTANMASGMDFDLCFTGYVNSYSKAARNGGLLDITTMIDKETPALKEALPKYAWEAAKMSDGKIYAVPNLQVFFNYSACEIRSEIADKYNFDFSSVKTIDDLEPFLEKVKIGEKGIYPYRPNYGTSMWTDIYDYEPITCGIVIDRKNKEILSLYDSDLYKKAVYKLHDWYNKGYIRPDVASVQDDTQDYNAGKYAFSNLSWKPGNAAVVKQSKGWDVQYVKFGKPYFNRSSATLTMTGIGHNSKNPVLALKLIELMNTNTELYNIICYGVEGKHYKLDEDKKIEYIPESGYAPKAPWKFGNQFNAILEKGQADDVWEETAELNETSEKSPLLGFVLDTDSIVSEISQVESIISEYKVMKTGAENPDNYWDTMKKRLKSAGYDKIKAEVERQVKEFLKNS